ncbi:MAG: hypothetical protein Q7K34_04940 [archaeon]|nr:hypothetical protein [archaeon]
MAKGKKWKVIIPEKVVEKISELSEKDQKKIMNALEKLAENPYIGKPFNAVEIKPWANEVCKCGKPFFMLLEIDDNEVHCKCRTGDCGDSFWCTKKELVEGRKKYVKDAKSAGKEIEYEDIKFVE